MKIAIDAGHYGNRYNAGAVKGYYESNMTWTLQGFLGFELEKRGFDVVLIRQDKSFEFDYDDTVNAALIRGTKAAGCDLLISLHSNSVKTESVQRVVVIHPLNNNSKEIAENLAQTIHSKMSLSKNQPFQLYQKRLSENPLSKNYKIDSYALIRGAISVGVQALILEHSFHSNIEACQWLTNVDNLKKLAIAEAETLAAFYGVKPKGMPFTDIKPDHWAYQYFKVLYDNGIINGYPDGTLKPTQIRSEMAKMLAVALKLL